MPPSDVEGNEGSRPFDQVDANVVVCGRFHYTEYVSHLEARGALAQFHFAGRKGENWGVSHSRLNNHWLKEYLYVLHSRLRGRAPGERWALKYHSLWQHSVLRSWRPAPILHVMLHGNCMDIIQQARGEGSTVIGEPVNAHPHYLSELLAEEHDRLGIASPRPTGELDERLADEARACDWLLTGAAVVRASFDGRGPSMNRTAVIPYPTDLRAFSPLRPEETGELEPCFRVICVGSITPRKGHYYLLEAWKRLCLKRAELLLVGRVDPVMKPILKRYEGLFRHIEHIPHKSLRLIYGQSDVFVLPSVEDGFAYVCTEAMGCGLPVVTTSATGASELIEEGVNGFVVPIRDISALQDRLLKLATAPSTAKQIGRAARRKMLNSGGWPEYATRVAGLYNSARRGGTSV